MVPPSPPAAGPSLVGVMRPGGPTVEDDAVMDAVRRAVESAGGLQRIVPAGGTVAIKPSLGWWLSARDGATTDPRVVATLVEMCRRAGAGRIVVGDAAMGDGRTSHALDSTGMRRASIQAGADEVLAFEEEPHADVPLRLPGRVDRAPVPRVVAEADVRINVGKAKTHFLDPVTASLTNWIGLIGQAERPRFMSDAILPDVVAAMHAAAPAALHVVDGLWAGEGNGPAATEPFWLGCVFAGSDPVAVDATVARGMGVAPWELRFARAAASAGLGVIDPARIRLAGARMEDISRRARRARPGLGQYPARVLVGEGVGWAGTLGHFRIFCDLLERAGAWPAVERTYGRPTFMLGAVEDPDFESYVSRGPYFVIDDAARVEYKEDPRVEFIPGHPATHTLLPYLLRRLRVERVYARHAAFVDVMRRPEAYFHLRAWNRPTQAHPARHGHG